MSAPLLPKYTLDGCVMPGFMPGIHDFLRPHVMPGHSRPKDGMLSHAYVPGIHVFIGWRAVQTKSTNPFIPAQAGIQEDNRRNRKSRWVPACAGTNGGMISSTSS